MRITTSLSMLLYALWIQFTTAQTNADMDKSCRLRIGSFSKLDRIKSFKFNDGIYRSTSKFYSDFKIVVTSSS